MGLGPGRRVGLGRRRRVGLGRRRAGLGRRRRGSRPASADGPSRCARVSRRRLRRAWVRLGRAVGPPGGAPPRVRLGLCPAVGLGVGRPLDVAAGGHRHVEDRPTEAAHDHDRADRRRGLDRLVGHGLEGDHRAAAQEAVGRDQVARLERVEPGRDRRRRVAAEDRREDGPQPAQREHGDGRLDQHRQEDPDPRPLPHPDRSEPASGEAHLPVELGPGEPADIAVLALPGQGRVVGSRGGPRLGGRDRVVERPDPPASRAGPPGQVQDRRRAALPVELEIVRRRAPEPAWSATACAWIASRPSSSDDPATCAARTNRASRESARSAADGCQGASLPGRANARLLTAKRSGGCQPVAGPAPACCVWDWR